MRELKEIIRKLCENECELWCLTIGGSLSHRNDGNLYMYLFDNIYNEILISLIKNTYNMYLPDKCMSYFSKYWLDNENSSNSYSFQDNQREMRQITQNLNNVVNKEILPEIYDLIEIDSVYFKLKYNFCLTVHCNYNIDSIKNEYSKDISFIDQLLVEKGKRKNDESLLGKGDEKNIENGDLGYQNILFAANAEALSEKISKQINNRFDLVYFINICKLKFEKEAIIHSYSFNTSDLRQNQYNLYKRIKLKSLISFLEEVYNEIK